jgi:hypothetical protein
MCRFFIFVYNQGMSRYLLPRVRDFIFIVIFVGTLLIGPRMMNMDSDLGRDIALGNYILDSHEIPTKNLLSFTKPGQSRPPYEWLAEVLFSISHRLLNFDGVVLLTAIVISAAFLIVYLDSVHRSNMIIMAALLTLWAAAASSLDWLTRPHIFSFLLIAIWIAWLEKIRSGEKINLWLFPVLMLIWANAHGGFIFGFLAWGAYFAGWLWEYWRKSSDINVGRKLMIIGGASLISSILTPDLWRNWQGVFGNNSLFILSHTTETMPPNLGTVEILPFTFLLALVFVLLLLGWKRIPTSQLFLLVGFALMSLTMTRNIPFFAIAAVPVLAGYISQPFSKMSFWLKVEEHIAVIDGILSGYVWPILISLLAIGSFAYYQTRTQTSFNQFNPNTFPVQAIDWIESHPLKGKMFNDLNWGGYILYRVWPGKQVFIDSQSDFYGESLIREYAGIFTAGGNWDGELKQYNVSWILVSPQTNLAKAASSAPDWQLAYEDSVAVIYVRK